MKQDICRYKIIISSQFYCECSSLQIANWRTCHHIVWLLLNLWNIIEGNQLLAQVDIGSSLLENLTLKVADEIPDSLTRIREDRTYDDKLINHPLFQREQMWYLGRKVSGSPCCRSRCLRPRCIQNVDLHLYVQGLLLLKEQRVVDTKHIFCLSACYVNSISSSYNSIRPPGNKSVFPDPQLRITAAEKEKVTKEILNDAHREKAT